MSEDDVEPAAFPVNAPAARPPGQRLMLGVVIGLGVLILAGLGAVVVGIARNLSGHGTGSAAAPAAEAALMLPPDARIEAMEVSGDRLVLRVATSAGEEIDIVDTRDGHVVSRIRPAPPEVPH